MRSGLSPARALLPMGLAVCLSPCGDLALYAVLVTELEVVGLTLGAVGIMLGVNRLIRIPGNPLAGMLLDRRGRRAIFVAGMLLGVLSTAGYAVLRGFWPFLAARLAWGIAWTLINVSGMAMVVDVTTNANRGRWMGVYNTSVLVGLAVGPIVGAFLVDVFGFAAGMLGCAGLTAVGLAVALLALPETYSPGQEGGARRSAAREGRHGLLRRAGLTSTQSLFQGNRALLIALFLFMTTQFAGDGVVLSTVSLLLKQRFGQVVAAAGVTLSIAAASGLILGMRSLLAGAAGPLAGRVSDGRSGRWAVVGGGLLASAVGFGLLAYDASLLAVVLGVTLSAIGTGATLAALGALVGDLTPPGKEGTVMGSYATAGDVGSTAGPFLAFALVSHLDLRWIYLFCCVAFALGLALAWVGHRWQPLPAGAHTGRGRG